MQPCVKSLQCAPSCLAPICGSSQQTNKQNNSRASGKFIYFFLILGIKKNDSSAASVCTESCEMSLLRCLFGYVGLIMTHNSDSNDLVQNKHDLSKQVRAWTVISKVTDGRESELVSSSRVLSTVKTNKYKEKKTWVNNAALAPEAIININRWPRCCVSTKRRVLHFILLFFLLFCFTICTLIRWISHSVQRFYANFRQVGWKITQVVIEKLCGLGLFCQKTLLLRHKLFLFVSICVDIEIKFNSVQSVNQPFNQSHVHIVRMLCIPPLSRQ